METRAILRSVRLSDQKGHLVADQIRAVQVLLPGNEGLYFPFVVFYKLVVGLPFG